MLVLDGDFHLAFIEDPDDRGDSSLQSLNSLGFILSITIVILIRASPEDNLH